jgi:hypothetical protein
VLVLLDLKEAERQNTELADEARTQTVAAFFFAILPSH